MADVSLSSHAEEIHPSAEAFPKLTEPQIERIRQIAAAVQFTDGQPLWEIGDRHASFYVIESGEVDIAQRRPDGSRRMIVRHGARGFTGDIDLLSEYASVVEGRAVGTVQALEICPGRLKQLIVADSDLSDVILAAFMARRRALISQNMGDVTLLGSKYSPDTFRIREFLERNSRPFDWVELESADNIDALLDGFGIRPEETPVLIDSNGQVLRNPSLDAMAECMGLSTVATDRIYDVIVVGAGPAGLATSVYAASEGLDVLTVDAVAPGGQASTSSKIENYLGFPTGVSGRDLAQRAYLQAEKFGAVLATPRKALKLDCSTRPFGVQIGDGESVRGRTVVIATGAQYRKLPIDGAERFEGRGIYFGATSMEARLCSGEEVAVVGGGNSAGQAAVYLSEHCKHVHVMVRSQGLAHSMSRYLIQRIEASPKITLHPFTQITAVHGDERMERIEVTQNRTGESRPMDCSHAFVMIGAAPNTDWLAGCIALDPKGFVLTGATMAPTDLQQAGWSLTRSPFLLETSKPGIFAAGDVRSGSTKRVAAAVGEGSISVQFIHQALSS